MSGKNYSPFLEGALYRLRIRDIKLNQFQGKSYNKIMYNIMYNFMYNNKLPHHPDAG